MAKRIHNFENCTHELLCPLCGEVLVNHEQRSMVCPQHHNFDFAKEGYLHLLPVNQKKSKIPGDDAMMISARAAFLEAGYYEPLVKKIKSILSDSLSTAKLTALDIGCGNGYYTKRVLCESGLFNTVLGTDISKHAVKSAAKTHNAALYFVSSAFNLPIQSYSIDFALSVFAPLLSSEISRILKKDGDLLVVSSGPQHLRELAEVIYEKFRPHHNSTQDRLADEFHFTSTTNLQFNILIKDSADMLNLLKMTPYYWNKDKEKIQKLEALADLTFTCDFQIDLLTPK